MKTFVPLFKKLLVATMLFLSLSASAQQSLKSILINHGAPSCNSSSGEQQLFTGILGGLPSVLLNCSNGMPFYSVFTAYNPKDKKIYFADIGSGNTTRMYALDYNFGGALSCMPATTPTYTYNYGISQLCFDQDGNNLVIYNYNAATGTGGVKRIDVATGADLPGTDKQLDFPADNAPNSLAWGDMVFMPNGRVFMTFGNTPSKLYELVDFNGPGNATAVFLTNIPRPCFSIGYVDGSLLVAGSDGSGCYYYTWDINSNTLSNSSPFPLGKSTADITHMNVGLGVSQELMGGSLVNSNTANIVYHVVIKNKGNIDIGNVALKNKLTDAFGEGNVSNVQISFVSNPAGLVLNPLYDGVLFTDMLLPLQTIVNYPVAEDSAVIRIQLRATNLVQNKIYYSSATTSGQSGAGLNILAVTDSSNNGDAAVIDMDFNGVSDDAGEGVPTPFMFNVLLPVSNLGFAATLNNDHVQLNWNSSNEANMKNFEAERSTDGINFTRIGLVAAKNTARAIYQYTDDISHAGAEKIYYRLKINDQAGKYTYSNIIIVSIKKSATTVNTYPNPFTTQVNIQTTATVRTTAGITLFDGTGKMVKHQEVNLQPGMNYITMDNLQSLAKGVYYLEVANGDKKTQSKIIK
ncbi:MAG: T9SS type A sorting domain-containing protein [Chitinophagaceae bacterium]